MKTLFFSLFLLTVGCSVTIGESIEFENDAGGAAISADVSAADASTSDASPMQPTIRLNPASPPARTVPPNSTGVLLGIYNVLSGDQMLPIRGFRFRRVGVGSTTDFSNLFAYMVPSTSASNEPFRYSGGYRLDPFTHTTNIRYSGDLRPRRTLTVYLYGDLAPGTTSGQHAFELLEVLTDTGTLPSLAVRSYPILIGAQHATRLDIRHAPMAGLVPRNQPGQTIASFDAIVGAHPAEIGNLALTLVRGSTSPVPFHSFELWLGERRIEIDTSVGINANRLVLTPITPISLTARSTNRFTIRATVVAETNAWFQLFLEYPSDLRARDLVLGEAAAVCISSQQVPGCNGPNQGAYNGTNGNESAFSVIDP